MRMRSFLAAARIGLIILFAQGLPTEAADVKVIAGTASRAVWEELTAEFERATGHKLVIWYGNATTTRKRIEAGEAFDLLVTGGTDEYAKQGKVAADTRAEIARVGMGVGARAGAPKPDISSVDAFKRALLNAQSVTYSPGGAGGIHVDRVFERLGIAEQMKAKARLQQQSGEGLALKTVADGEAEFVFAFTNQILLGRGVELVGPFPPELQYYNRFIAAVSTSAEQPELAKALIKFLRSPAAVAVIKAKGLEPVTP